MWINEINKECINVFTKLSIGTKLRTYEEMWKQNSNFLYLLTRNFWIYLWKQLANQEKKLIFASKFKNCIGNEENENKGTPYQHSFTYEIWRARLPCFQIMVSNWYILIGSDFQNYCKLLYRHFTFKVIFRIGNPI